MRYEFGVSGENRKALVKAIAEFTGQKAKYMGVPSCAYSIGELTVTKDGALEFEGEENLADLLQNGHRTSSGDRRVLRDTSRQIHSAYTAFRYV